MQKEKYCSFILVVLTCLVISFSFVMSFTSTNKASITTKSKEMLEGLYENPSEKIAKILKSGNTENVALKELFKTKEEAEKWLEEKENGLKDNYEITDKKLVELENQIISTEKVEISENFDTEEEANARKEKIENSDIESSNLSLEKKDAVVIDINKTFDTQEEALEFAKQYKEKYNVDLTVSEIYSEWVSNGTIKVKELSGLTKEERDKEIEKIKKEIEGASTDTIEYKVSITKTSKTEEVYIKDNVTSETKVFNSLNSLEEANNFINNLKLSENENIKFEIDKPKLNKVPIGSETSKIEEIFDTEAEIEAYIKKLKEEGYILSDIDKEKLIEKETEKVPTGKVIVNDSKKEKASTSYEVNGNYLVIKQASGNVAVWTMEKLTKTEQESFKESWLNKKGSDGSVSNDDNFVFIYGIGEHDLSYMNAWGKYNISFDGNTITMTCDKISHLYYGNFEQEYTEQEIEVVKYKISGTKTMNIYKDEYSVSYKKIEKIYEPKETYGAIINKEEFVRDVKHNVKGSYKEKQEVWVLSGEYIKNNRGSLYLAMINAKIKETNNDENKPNEEQTPKNQMLTNKNQNAEITPPYTGVSDPSDNNLIISLVVMTISTVLVIIKRKVLFD